MLSETSRCRDLGLFVRVSVTMSTDGGDPDFTLGNRFWDDGGRRFSDVVKFV